MKRELFGEEFIKEEEKAVDAIRTDNKNSLYWRIGTETVENYTGNEENILSYFDGLNELREVTVYRIIEELEKAYPDIHVMDKIMKKVDRHYGTKFIREEFN